MNNIITLINILIFIFFFCIWKSDKGLDISMKILLFLLALVNCCVFLNLI
jgi:hypothetical protein